MTLWEALWELRTALLTQEREESIELSYEAARAILRKLDGDWQEAQQIFGGEG